MSNVSVYIHKNADWLKIAISHFRCPVIEQEQKYIKTEAGKEIHITFVVHAYPEPQAE